MHRLIAICVVLLWLTAMTSLFIRDVWPAWTAQDPPPMTSNQFPPSLPREQQYGILRGQERIGTAWVDITVGGSMTMIRGTIQLNSLPLLPEVRVETTTDFAEGTLDRFLLDVYGTPLTINVRGERRGIYFPCTLQVGPIHHQASLDLSSSRLIGETLRPFSFLPNLQVGQSWRMQLLDPVSAAMSRRAEFKSIVAKVTARESLVSPLSGERVECLVVETIPRQVKAWVDLQGRVLVQEVDMPGFGRLTVKEEPYEKESRAAAKQRIRRGATLSEMD